MIHRGIFFTPPVMMMTSHIAFCTRIAAGAATKVPDRTVRAWSAACKLRLGPGQLVSETLVVGLELSYDADRLVIECGAQGLVGDWVHGALTGHSALQK